MPATTPTTAPSRSPSPSVSTKKSIQKSSNKKKSSVKPKKKKLKKSYISKKTRKWQRRWITKKVLGGYKIKVLAWVSSDKPAMSTAKETPIIGRSYTCLKCNKSFQDNSGLRKHMRIHGEKTFKCTWEGCDKRFIDNSKLKRHMLVHTGEKRFVCPYENCNKRFSLDFNLKSHMKRHARDRKFPTAKKKSSTVMPSPAPSPTSTPTHISQAHLTDAKAVTPQFPAAEFVMMQPQVLPTDGNAFAVPTQHYQQASPVMASLYRQARPWAPPPPGQ
mmetsp:Transcript_17976/g.26940  ORF Transcript_17976/g.26940 Transcript_17976/m.26940 type:complete len:274 (+) Transcript_17976:18-839(+)